MRGRREDNLRAINMFGFSRPTDMIRHLPSNKTRRSKYAFGFGGCILDLDPAYGTNTKTNGALVSSWIDQAIGMPFVNSAGLPSYVSSDANYNNNPSLSFGTSGRLVANTPVGIHGGFTILAVAKVDIFQNRNTAFDDAGGTEVGLLMAGNNVGVSGIGYYRGSVADVVGTTEDTAAHIVVITPTSIWVDGVKEGTSSPFKANSIARVGGATNASLRGTLARLVVLDHALSDSEVPILSDNANAQYLVY
jgi:hypothetical protein